MASRWRAVAEPRLSWRSWDGEFVVYNDASGDTHQLDAVSAHALRALEGAPADAAELAGRVAASAEAAADAKLRARMARLLDRLRALGLVEPAGP